MRATVHRILTACVQPECLHLLAFRHQDCCRLMEDPGRKYRKFLSGSSRAGNWRPDWFVLCLWQFVLAEKPATAYFLKPEERSWLANRQDTLQANFNSKHSRQGRWWASVPDWCAPVTPALPTLGSPSWAVQNECCTPHPMSTMGNNGSFSPHTYPVLAWIMQSV